MISGDVVGRLLLLEKVQEVGRSKWLCLCECGNKLIVPENNLKSENTRSCGCLRHDLRVLSNTTHNMSGTRPHNIYKAMKGRCNNPNNQAYKDYGGRGIAVCQRWNESFENFWDDMCETYSPDLTLDRIDVDGDYSKDNCRWVSMKLQARNKKMSALNNSGVTGVCFRANRGVEGSWVAQWMSLDGKVCGKSFSVSRFGFDTAFSLAVEVRNDAITKLNEQNAGYTQNHGKG